MSIDYTVGDQVVCIDTRVIFPSTAEILAKISEGSVYTVAEMGVHPFYPELVMVILEGITHKGMPVVYTATRFRKVQKPSKGMEILRGLLKTKEKVTEDA